MECKIIDNKLNYPRRLATAKDHLGETQKVNQLRAKVFSLERGKSRIQKKDKKGGNRTERKSIKKKRNQNPK